MGVPPRARWWSRGRAEGGRASGKQILTPRNQLPKAKCQLSLPDSPPGPPGGDRGRLCIEGQDLLSLGQKFAQKAAGGLPGCHASLVAIPGLHAPLRVVAAFFRSGYQIRLPSAELLALLPQTSSPAPWTVSEPTFPVLTHTRRVERLPVMVRSPPPERPGRKTSPRPGQLPLP